MMPLLVGTELGANLAKSSFERRLKLFEPLLISPCLVLKCQSVYEGADWRIVNSIIPNIVHLFPLDQNDADFG